MSSFNHHPARTPNSEHYFFLICHWVPRPKVFQVAGFFFGYIKRRFTGSAPLRGAVQTLIIRADAAAAAFFILKLMS